MKESLVEAYLKVLLRVDDRAVAVEDDDALFDSLVESGADFLFVQLHLVRSVAWRGFGDGDGENNC